MHDDMPDYPIRDAQLVRPEALGEPGARRFRIVIVAQDETFILWLEKQQVEALGLAIQHLLDALPSRPLSEPDGFIVPDEETLNQFRVGKIQIAFDEATETVILAAHDIDGEETPTLAVRISRDIAHAVSVQAAVLMTQGRPICPMCGEPMERGEPHVCPQQNGHLPVDFDDDEFWTE